MSQSTDNSSQPSRRFFDVLGGVMIAACGLAVVVGRAGVFELYGKLRVQSDSYALPSPEQTAVMSLGYRAAAADFIYAHTRVSYGIHFQEKRRFEHVGRYLDTINYLDPKLAEPYLYADTFLTLQPEPPRQQDYDKAKTVLLRGTQNLPYHQELWFTAGQFIAYVAPPHLDSQEKKDEWRLTGAKLLARACELASNNERIPRHCIVAASLLNKAGEQEALISMLDRTIAVVDDPEVQELARAARAKWTRERDTAVSRDGLERAWREDLSFVPLDQFFVLGPPMSVEECAGMPASLDFNDGACSPTWRDWVAQRATDVAD